MFADAHLPGVFERLRRLLLELARTRDPEALQARVVERLAEAPEVTRACLWSGPPDALELVGAAGRGRGIGPDAEASIDAALTHAGRSERVATVARTGEAHLARIQRGADAETPRWMLDGRLRGVALAPLIGREATLGVLGVYTWRPVDPAALDSLRVVADHLAAAMDTVSAFAEVERLRAALEEENALLREEVDDVARWGGLVGRSSALRSVLERIDIVAPTAATVLIHGESGVGKELVAREIHRRSGRARKPMVRVNCASIPGELFESEFFGHVRGAFTGATRDRLGRFAAADEGTLFLDEVGEIPLGLQGKLLRVLQEGQYERVGEEQTRTVDVRILAATNRDLRVEVEAGRFRRDLYYRLDVFPVEVVPLRQRPDDIEPLARHFAERAVQRFNVAPTVLDRVALQALEAHDWPGNVRELRNAVERAVLVHQGGPLRFELTPGRSAPAVERPDAILRDDEMQARVRANIERALAASGGRVYGPDGAAVLLGLPATTLASRLKSLGLK